MLTLPLQSLQAAYASNQDLDVYTELIQAGLGLYLLKAPRSSGFSCSNGQLDAILDSLAHQDLWTFQRLLWLRILPSIAKWDSMQVRLRPVLSRHGCGSRWRA